MFESIFGTQIEFYNDINADVFDFKYQTVEPRLNDVGLWEIPIDLSDVVLKGAGDSMDRTEYIISKFQLDLNMLKLKHDAYKGCLDNAVCSQ